MDRQNQINEEIRITMDPEPAQPDMDLTVLYFTQLLNHYTAQNMQKNNLIIIQQNQIQETQEELDVLRDTEQRHRADIDLLHEEAFRRNDEMDRMEQLMIRNNERWELAARFNPGPPANPQQDTHNCHICTTNTITAVLSCEHSLCTQCLLRTHSSSNPKCPFCRANTLAGARRIQQAMKKKIKKIAIEQGRNVIRKI